MNNLDFFGGYPGLVFFQTKILRPEMAVPVSLSDQL